MDPSVRGAAAVIRLTEMQFPDPAIFRAIDAPAVRRFAGLCSLAVLSACWVTAQSDAPGEPGATPIVRINPSDGLPYVWIAPGVYDEGCSAGDTTCFKWELSRHRVAIRNGFWIGQTEVTQEAYERVTGTNPSLYLGLRRPVDRVSWYDARHYCEAVGMRLPAEVEWEFAARGGTPAARYGQLDDIAWHDGNSNGATHEVAGKRPNAFGLYDTLGNVWEWVEDVYLAEPGKRVLRGDSFYNLPKDVRVSDRLWATPDTAHRDMGVRCAGDRR